MVADDAPTIVLSGEIDFFTAPAVCRALDDVDGPAVIDLSGVTLLSAAGLNELAKLAKRVGAERVVLAAPRPAVRRVLEIVGFDAAFTIVDASPAPPPDPGG